MTLVVINSKYFDARLIIALCAIIQPHITKLSCFKVDIYSHHENYFLKIMSFVSDR